MKMSEIDQYERSYRRQMVRSSFQSLFWHVLLERKKEIGLTLKGLADRLGINKSYISRSFSEPPNWQIDKISDMSDALGVDIIITARDRRTGRMYTPHGGTIEMAATSSLNQYPASPSMTLSAQSDNRVTA